MKTSDWLLVVVAAMALALQGCASEGGVKYAPGAEPVAATQTSSTSGVVTSVRTKSDLNAVRAAVEQQMQASGRFSSVSSSGRATVNGRFDDMASLFTQYGSVDKMGPSALERVNDDQNAINAVLAQYDGNTMVCDNEVQLGSHFSRRVCRTLSEIRNQQNSSQQAVRRAILQSNPATENKMIQTSGGH